ncbi:hypothetical protein [Lysobacter sp. F6437]|uniref:hypothetical protein n=1 Tax=Lysobacter sp. F6437 TaxID=3459296 RepID=UPI00403E21DB
MATAGSIVVDLLAKTASFETDIKRSEKSVRDMGKAAREAGKVIGTAIATGATIAATAAAALGRDLANTADEITRFATLSNTSTDTFQRWAAGAQTVGIQQDKLADILKDMQDRVGDFIQTGGGPMLDFFEQIAPKVGVTAEQFAKLSGPDALQLFVDSLDKANISANDFTFYMEAIASDSTLLLPLLRNNGAAMKALGDEAASVGAIMEGSTLAAAQALKSEMHEMERATNGLKFQIGDVLLPVLVNLADEFNDVITDVDNARLAVDTFEIALDGVVSIGGSIVSTGQSIRSAIGGIGIEADDSAESLRQLVQSARGLAAIPASMAAYFDATVTGSEDAVRRFNEANAEIRAGWTGKPIPEMTGPGPAADYLDLPSYLGGDPEFSAVGFSAIGPMPRSSGAGRATGGGAEGTRERTAAKRDLIEVERELTMAEKEALAMAASLNAVGEETLRMTAENDAAKRAAFAATEGFIQQLEWENSLISMGNLERETEIALRHAGAVATEEQRLRIADLIAERERELETVGRQTEAMDALRDSARGFANDLYEGVGAWDALKKAAGDFADQLYQMATDQLIDQILGKKGDSGGGAYGDALGSIFGAIFGGGKAGGGDVFGGTRYLVGEEGPEMFVPRTAGTILPASQTAAMTGGGGGFNQTLQFALAAPTDPRTQQQIAQRVGFETQRASNRNR